MKSKKEIIKRIIQVLVIIIFCGCLGKIDKPNSAKPKVKFLERVMNKLAVNRDDLGFNGQVKYVFEFVSNPQESINFEAPYQREYLSDEFWKKEIAKSSLAYANVYVFDEEGFLVKEINHFDGDNFSMQHIRNHLFDKNQNLIHSEENRLPAENSSEISFTYDTKNRVIEATSKEGTDEKIFKIEIEYLEDTILVLEYQLIGEDTLEMEKTLMNVKGEFIEDDDPYFKQFFDERGNLIREEFIEDTFLNLSAVIYEYDSRDNKIKETEYDTFSNIKASEMNYYDEENKLYQRISYDSSSTEIQRFDTHGNITEYIYSPLFNSEDRFHGYWKNYDKNGNVIKESEFQKDSMGSIIENIIEFEYQYDNLDNWTIRRASNVDTINEMIRREISYF